MDAKDIFGLLHPAISVILIFPILGMVVSMAWQTRQRRLKIASGGKSLIPPIVNREHVKLGHWLTAGVVGLTLIALAYSIVFKGKLFEQERFSILFILFMFAATVGALAGLYKAQSYVWRSILATLSSAGLIILGCQEGVYRRTWEWYVSHYYSGIAVSILMIIALTIAPKIYEDRSNRWRKVHVLLNCLALFLFLIQGVTGSRDLLEIPLNWQLKYLEKCDFTQQVCPQLESPPS
jgi:peptidoglycan/LPS O-acetylase OafA/YrhL